MDDLEAFVPRAERRRRTLVPVPPALAPKIELTVDEEVATLASGERCLAVLKSDGRRLTMGA